MFEISNLKKETKDGWTYLRCKFDVTEIDNPFNEKEMWFAVEEKNEDMLADNVYDAFVLVPLILGMYYGQDVHIRGNISPRLYHNIQHYLLTIFDNFSDRTKKVNFSVEGFDTVKQIDNPLIGTGISCGVDSLLTIYDNFVEENDPNFKINSLFLVNTGTHGDFENPKTYEIWLDRAKLNKEAANELNLPMYIVNSNFHAFTHKIDEETIGFLPMYSCFMGLQKYVKRYLTASALSYEEIAENYKSSRDKDIAEYCESYMCHLISTEVFELVIDGCQYTRPEKTEKIANWKIAQKYLNVCVNPIEHAHNCTVNCQKCIRTLLPLEAIGKLEKFSNVFDINLYKQNSKKWKIKFSALSGKDPLVTNIVEFCKDKGLKMPNKYLSRIIYFANRVIKKIFKR